MKIALYYFSIFQILFLGSYSFSQDVVLDPEKEEMIFRFNAKTKNDWLFILAHDENLVEESKEILKQKNDGKVELKSGMLSLMPSLAMDVDKFAERELTIELIKTTQQGLESPILLRYKKEDQQDAYNAVGFEATRFLPYNQGDRIVKFVTLESSIENPGVIVHRFAYSMRGEKARKIYIIFSKSFDIFNESKLSRKFVKPEVIKDFYNKYHNKTPDKQVKKDREEAEK